MNGISGLVANARLLSPSHEVNGRKRRPVSPRFAGKQLQAPPRLVWNADLLHHLNEVFRSAPVKLENFNEAPEHTLLEPLSRYIDNNLEINRQFNLQALNKRFEYEVLAEAYLPVIKRLKNTDRYTRQELVALMVFNSHIPHMQALATVAVDHVEKDFRDALLVGRIRHPFLEKLKERYVFRDPERKITRLRYVYSCYNEVRALRNRVAQLLKQESE